MDESQFFSLKWNLFKENFTSHFEFLKAHEQFVDVTFCTQGKYLKAHKVILSASSAYLMQIFKDNPCKHPVLIMDRVPYSHLEGLLEFIYTGGTNIPENELAAFLETANALQVRGLSEKAQVSLKSHGDGDGDPVEDSSSKKRFLSNTENTTHLPKKICSKRESQRNSRHINELEAIHYDENLAAEPKVEMKNEISVPFDLEYTGALLRGVTQDGAKYPDAKNEWEISPGSYPSDNELVSGDGRRRHSLDPRPCPICNRLYSNLSNLRQHLRLIHNPQVVKCRICSKTFKTDLYLRRHLISFHDIQPDVINDHNLQKSTENVQRTSKFGTMDSSNRASEGEISALASVTKFVANQPHADVTENISGELRPVKDTRLASLDSAVSLVRKYGDMTDPVYGKSFDFNRDTLAVESGTNIISGSEVCFC